LRLKDDEIDRLAEKVLIDLTNAGLISLKKERGSILAGIREAVKTDIQAEEALERDAAALLERTLQSMRGGPEIDRYKMLKMIKEKLAKERKMVL
jgi:hypothetical protein